MSSISNSTTSVTQQQSVIGQKQTLDELLKNFQSKQVVKERIPTNLQQSQYEIIGGNVYHRQYSGSTSETVYRFEDNSYLRVGVWNHKHHPGGKALDELEYRVPGQGLLHLWLDDHHRYIYGAQFFTEEVLDNAGILNQVDRALTHTQGHYSNFIMGLLISSSCEGSPLHSKQTQEFMDAGMSKLETINRLVDEIATETSGKVKSLTSSPVIFPPPDLAEINMPERQPFGARIRESRRFHENCRDDGISLCSHSE
ncbi:MAG: hypothetical protein OXU45_00385 [Candidatus Melainabacteria bacterium]|nr:hypothetical protein [Candidatus Melainabacteria bacterium]